MTETEQDDVAFLIGLVVEYWEAHGCPDSLTDIEQGVAERVDRIASEVPHVW